MGSLSAVYSTFVLVLVLSVSEAKAKSTCIALSGCSSHIRGYISIIPTAYGYEDIVNERNLGEICRKTEIATKCIREYKDECDSTFVLTYTNMLESEAVYLCREDMREETKAMLKTECYQREELRPRIRDGIDICNEQFMGSQGAVDCELENKRAECILKVVNENNCGADYVRYVIRRETDAVREKLGCPLVKV